MRTHTHAKNASLMQKKERNGNIGRLIHLHTAEMINQKRISRTIAAKADEAVVQTHTIISSIHQVIVVEAVSRWDNIVPQHIHRIQAIFYGT